MADLERLATLISELESAEPGARRCQWQGLSFTLKFTPCTTSGGILDRRTTEWFAVNSQG